MNVTRRVVYFGHIITATTAENDTAENGVDMLELGGYLASKSRLSNMLNQSNNFKEIA